MCGIAGIVSFEGKVDNGLVEKMGDALAHRGPDGKWFWNSENNDAVFAYRRLAILDPEHCLFEPFVWNNKFLVLYNGEIYNYRELREKLEAKGYAFNSTSDAEVLPALYDCYGEACLEKIDGMFSFALWDVRKNELFCARDRFGEKPFFYEFNRKQFRFASEIKALRKNASTTLNEQSLFRYLGYNLVENPDDVSQTFYDNIKRLPPATWLKLSADGDVTLKTYWQLDNNKIDNDISLNTAVEHFDELLHDSVSTRLHADTEVGCTVSGGLDSSSVLALMYRAQPGVLKTFTARIRDKQLDEGPFVATLLEHIPATNFETWVDEGLLIQSLDELLHQQEEPVADLTVLAQAHLMKLVAAHGVKVLLDGQGSDETLGGYDYFVEQFLKDRFHQSIGSFRNALHDVEEKRPTFKRLGGMFYLDMLAPALRRSLGRARRSVSPPHLRYLNHDFVHPYRHQPPPFARFESLQDALHYRTTRYGLHKLLRYADRNAMAHGIEVRFPFLSHALVEFVFSLPSDFKIHHGWTKYVLRKAMENKLPPSIAWRADKLGYTVPTKAWLAHPRVMEMVRDAQYHLATRKIVKPDVKLNQREATAVLIASRFVD